MSSNENRKITEIPAIPLAVSTGAHQMEPPSHTSPWSQPFPE